MRSDQQISWLWGQDRQAAILTGGAQKMLTRYRWPGNIREFENAMERALVEQALERSGLIQKDAARLPGVSSRALNFLLKPAV